MTVNVHGIEIEVRKKKIKNLHLYVKPDGSVLITAPTCASGAFIEKFAAENIGWIRAALEKIKDAAPVPPRLYESGESVYIWGDEYPLTFTDGMRNAFELRGGGAFLRMSRDSTPEERIKYMRSQYRIILADEIERLMRECERITGLKSHEWHIKYMKTRWGTCNPEAKRIWFSLQLIQHPKECLKYVILHELAHLRVRGHGADFRALMDIYMPQWREVKAELNKSIDPRGI